MMHGGYCLVSQDHTETNAAFNVGYEDLNKSLDVAFIEDFVSTMRISICLRLFMIESCERWER